MLGMSTNCDILKPCRLSAALISPPPHGHNGYNLKAVANMLEEHGYSIRVITNRILIVVNKNGLESSIYPSGKILIKTRNINKARKECMTIRGIVDGI